MAQIVINEISQNYTYNIGTSSYCTVALPITASWGSGYTNPETGMSVDDMLENVIWSHFPATQAGLESFVSTYRGPASNYRLVKDFSYQIAMTLLTSGHDVLVCRVCPGNKADGSFTIGGKVFGIKAKYAGTFGNNLKVKLTKVANRNYWNLIVFVADKSGIQNAVENLVFVFEEDNMTDTIPHIADLESNFVTFVAESGITDSATAPTVDMIQLIGGTDTTDFTAQSIAYAEENSCLLNHADGSRDTINGIVYKLLETEPSDWVTNYTSYYTKSGTTGSEVFTAVSVSTPAPTFATDTYYEQVSVSIANAVALATERYSIVSDTPASTEYVQTLEDIKTDVSFMTSVYHREWCFNAAITVLDLLKDKLNYNPNRLTTGGWDDQDFNYLTDDIYSLRFSVISPLHKKLMEVAYFSRCGTGMIDIPRSCPRKYVFDESSSAPGYAQLLSRVDVAGGTDVNTVLYTTHSALFAPWGQYKYVGTSKQNIAPPSLLAMLIQRAMILNQSLQYEWALPTNRRHNLSIGKFDYKVPKKLLDVWQTLEGVGVNTLTEIPELGTTLWGNSTLYEVPPATYQALANLSTRYLVNAVEDVAYRCGISITYQYNNEQAYNKFYAGVTPLLDTMKNVGAIEDYYVKMRADINGLDQVNANSVIGKIYLIVNGVINDIYVDLIALPPGTDLGQYRG